MERGTDRGPRAGRGRRPICGEHLRRLRERFRRPRLLALTRRFRPNDSAPACTRLSNAARAGARADGRHQRRALSRARRAACCRMSSPASATTHHRRGRLPAGAARRPLPQSRRDEMARLFTRYPEALCAHAEIAERCRFSLDELAYTIRPKSAMTGSPRRRRWKS